MLIVGRLGEHGGEYFLRGPAGYWIGAGCPALELSGPMTTESLRSVLAARDPRDHHPLLARRVAHRRAGRDLTFAAPKSLSLLAAMVRPDQGAGLVAAHHQAVGDAVGYLEARACWSNRAGRLVAVEGLVAAGFGHAASAAGEPHLHTHVLVANLVRAHDGQWSALATDPFWLTRRAVDALYLLGLRQHLRAQGLALEWQIGPEGRADIAGVPRAAIDAASSRRRQIEAGLANRPEITSRAKLVLARQSRDHPLPPTPDPQDGHGHQGGHAPPANPARPAAPSEQQPPWLNRVAATGFDRQAADALAVAPFGPAAIPAALDNGTRLRVAAWLAGRQSTFAVTDVLCALAATVPTGLSVAQAEAWATEFCRQAIPETGGRWTTPLARAADDRLVALATRRAATGVGVVVADAIDGAVADRPQASSAAMRAARQLVSSGDGVSVLAGQPRRDCWWTQAEAIDLARAAWQATGYRVAVLTPTTAAVRRWEALTGASPIRSVAELSERGPAPGVLVVDRADRRTTAELTTLIFWANDQAAKLVMVLGGTQAARRQPLSTGLAEVGRRLECPEVGPPDPLDRGWTSAVDTGPRSAVLSGPDAARVLLQRWDDARAAGGETPWLIGQGPAEVDVFNRAVRARLVEAGTVSGPAVVAGGRTYQAGDRVVGIRQTSVPAGSVGRVTTTDPQTGTITVAWDRPPVTRGDPTMADRAAAIRRGPHLVTLDRHQAARISHGYATTPAMLRLVDGPLLLLGDPRPLGVHRDRVQHAALVIPARAMRSPAVTEDRLACLAAEATRLAVPSPQASNEATGLPIGQSLADLARERGALAARLQATLPPDPRVALRAVDDIRHWAAATAGHTQTLRPADALRHAQSRADHTALAQRRWVLEHGEALRRWELLGRTMEARRAALGHLLATDPADPRRLALGPLPGDAAGQKVWQRAAHLVASYDDRWPDRPGESGESSREAVIDRVGRDAARRQLDGRAHDRSIDR